MTTKGECYESLWGTHAQSERMLQIRSRGQVLLAQQNAAWQCATDVFQSPSVLIFRNEKRDLSKDAPRYFWLNGYHHCAFLHRRTDIL